MERNEVYRILDSERDYQDQKWTAPNAEHGIPDNEKSVAEWISFMEYHLEKAKACVYNIKIDDALAEVRKITALGVKTMESLGCPERRIIRVYKIDVGNIPPEEMGNYVKNVLEEFKKNCTTTFDNHDLMLPDSDIFNFQKHKDE